MKNKRKSSIRRKDVYLEEEKIVKLFFIDMIPINLIRKKYNCSFELIQKILIKNLGTERVESLKHKMKENGIFGKDYPKIENKIISLYNTNKSVSYLSNKFKVSYKVIKRILNKNNIEIRDYNFYKKIIKPSNTRFDLNKQKKEIIKLYFSGNSIKEIATKLKCSSYPISRILNEENIEIKPVSFYTKGKPTWMTGKKHIKETINKLKKARAKQIFPIKDSKIEVKIQNFLKQLGIEFFTHQYMKEIKHGYQCDILIPSMDLVIECDGDYWHEYPIGREIDHIRTKELIEKGFKVLRLWEFEIENMDLQSFSNSLAGVLEI